MTNAKEVEIIAFEQQTRTTDGYDNSRLNAVQHGILSKFTVLPWEDDTEYQALLDDLCAEHSPAGPTEKHLVVELAGVVWRKRRLRMAELACFNRGLDRSTCNETAQVALAASKARISKADVKSAIASNKSDTEDSLVALQDDQAMTYQALNNLASNGADLYAKAVTALHESTREAWQDQLTWAPSDYDDGSVPYTPDSKGLRRFLETEILPWYDQQRIEIEARPQIRRQALGESLDPDQLERLSRYETHLDRKFERALSTLLKLQDLRSRLRGNSA